MSYLLYRIKESNGFISRRAFHKAYYTAMLTYGECAIFGRRLLVPEMMYAPNPPIKSDHESGADQHFKFIGTNENNSIFGKL